RAHLRSCRRGARSRCAGAQSPRPWPPPAQRRAPNCAQVLRQRHANVVPRQGPSRAHPLVEGLAEQLGRLLKELVGPRVAHGRGVTAALKAPAPADSVTSLSSRCSRRKTPTQQRPCPPAPSSSSSASSPSRSSSSSPLVLFAVVLFA